MRQLWRAVQPVSASRRGGTAPVWRAETAQMPALRESNLGIGRA